MSDPNLSIQRQIQGLQFDVERIRKADTGLSAGTAFPSTPGTNLLFYRSDLSLLCYYDGTRWLTVHETAHPLKLNDASAPTTYAAAGNTITVQSAYRSDYALYITRVASVTNVAATNNATNFWTYTLAADIASTGSSQTIHTFTTAADAAGVGSTHDSAPSTSAVVSSRNYFYVVVSKTLAPGALTYWSTVYYRLVVT